MTNHRMRTTALLVAALGLAFALLTPATLSHADSDDTGSISGTLVRAESGEAGREYMVLAVLDGTDERFSTTTNFNGNFTLDGLPPGEYQIIVFGTINFPGRSYWTHYPGTVLRIEHELVTVNPGEAVEGVNFAALNPVQLFSDIPAGHQFFHPVGWFGHSGITTGYADGTFRGDNGLRRDAMAAFLYRAAGSPEFTPPTTSPFPDVPLDHQFYKEITWLADTGITTGYADRTFRPGTAVERQAAAAFLFRWALIHWDGLDPNQGFIRRFNDVQIGHQFFTEINWLRNFGISEGFADNSFRPRNNIQRQAIATWIMKVTDHHR